MQSSATTFERTLLLCLVLALPAEAQTAPRADAHTHTQPVVQATRVRMPLRIDGKLDEAAWQLAVPVSEFWQVEPEPGLPASERTEVRLLITNDALYVGARLHDSQVTRIDRRLTRRDEEASSDYFAVSLDPYHDHQSGVRLLVTPAGSITDGTIAGGSTNVSWDAVWEAGTTTDSAGWTAELRIPLSQLRYDAKGDGTWGIQFERFILRRQERALFAYVPRGEAAGAERFGHLQGMLDLSGSRYLEVLPYASGQQQSLTAETAGPLGDRTTSRFQAGADVKYALTRSLRLSSTINPDFGQVEVDPAVVNLTAFENVFPEKRPFFVEGTSFFSFGRLRAFNAGPHALPFYSRRIGRTPQLSGFYSALDAPKQTRIAAAGKLTGRTTNGWTIGLLDARTLTEDARVLNGPTGSVNVNLEPAANYGVARIAKSARGGATSLGALLTVADRGTTDSLASRVLRSSAIVGGFDLNHAWSAYTWALDANAVWSQVSGSAEAIGRTQRSSARYFQRPDQRHSVYDLTRTSLSGHSLEAALTKLRSEHWVGSIAYQESSPGYEPNDLGLLLSAGRRMLSLDWHYQENRPGKYLRNYIIWPFSNHIWNFDGDRLQPGNFTEFSLWLQGELTNYTQVVAWVGLDRQGIDDQLTRGGPVTLAPPRRHAYGKIASDSRKLFTFGATVDELDDDAGGRATTLSATAGWRPRSTLQLRFEPTYALRQAPAQYVQSEAAPSFDATFGWRYVFAALHDRSLTLDTRVDWVFTPRLSLQAYLQPLLASGRFTDYKQLARARSFNFDVYGRTVGTIKPDGETHFAVDPDGPGPAAPFRIANQDFKLRSLRANAVLRWEYRPGSTLFLVWQQLRNAYLPNGDLRPGRDLSDLVRDPADNVFLIKATYWLGL